MRAARAGRRIVMRPTEHGFVGPLAGELEEYIRFKASMGRHGATRVQVLRSFDRHCVLLQCLFDRFGSVFPQCGLMVFPGVVIVSR